jgi:cob(I)alamin adenosyltransferase
MKGSFIVDAGDGKMKVSSGMSITTKRGDGGFTDLLFGGKARKGDPQIEGLGAVDELNAALGLARVVMEGEAAEAIDRLQGWLVTLMGELAMPAGKEAEYEKAGFGRIGTEEIAWVERLSSAIEGEEPFKGWLRPGERGGELAARLHVARTVARRAERRVWEVPDEVARPTVRIFLNRLSDALWLMAQQ